MSARSRTIKLFCPSLSKLIPLVAVEEQRLDLGSIARTFGLDPASLKLNGHFVSRGVDLISSSVTWKSLLSFFSSRGLSTGANDADALIVDGKLCKAGTKMQISRAEARAAAAAAERQAQLKEARARDVQQKHPKGKKRGASTSQALPRKKPRSEGPTIEVVRTLESPCRGASPPRASSLGADFRSPRGSYSRAKVGFVPRWSIKEGETLTIGRVARELVQKGSLPGDAAEAQSQGTKAMITSTCVFMAAAQTQVGQLTIRTEALARDLRSLGMKSRPSTRSTQSSLRKWSIWRPTSSAHNRRAIGSSASWRRRWSRS
ncbi:uncharacterized protein LOC122090606 isoform X1 [Macadamia integrifolia]|uniref:uncharacterized protein LOC122090606 isoform X1 n=1 Tax=Macadamia integrifolia TaxID=60698 RepID=UPI001C4F5B09|nr:uncharacterized protein LOC122090606 isoform X1 [Macadamia integrifolia]